MEKFGKSNIIAMIIILLNLAVLIAGFISPLGIVFSIAGISVITLIGMLIFTNTISKSSNLDKGEMRKSITVTFLIVYILVCMILTFPQENLNIAMGQSILGHLSTLVGMLITFYFASSSVRQFLEYKKSKE